MNQEVEPSEMNEGELRELEYSYMQRSAETVDTESPSWLNCISAAEHKLFGSGVDGGVFHPNLPIAVVAGCPLEQINQKRRETNEANRGRVDVYIGDDLVRFEVGYKDLTAEVINNPEAVQTFEIGQGESLFTGKKNETPENIEELVAQRMKKGQEEARPFLFQRPP